MGTMLQKYGLEAGDYPEELNYTQASLIQQIHSDYLDAGANIIISNTFGANALKMNGLSHSVSEIITQAIKIARADTRPHFVALDLGPLGELLEPVGSLSFERAYNLFKEQVIAGTQAGADVILIETITDLYEARAAILAAKENSHLPVFCTMTFEKQGRTLTGTDPITMVHSLEALGVDALGVNCSLGPQEILPIVDQILQHASIPVIVSPNAGLPEYIDGETVFTLAPEDFAQTMRLIAQKGAKVLGGCCGTNPTFITEMIKQIQGLTPQIRSSNSKTFVCSPTNHVELGTEFRIVGERINPTGNSKIKAALRTHNLDAIFQEAIAQKEAGADILDVNIGIPEIDEPAMMVELVKELQTLVEIPLQIDSSKVEALEAAVRVYNGVPIINSVSGKADHMAKVFPIVKKYGACVIGLAMDERGLPKTIEDRVNITKKIIDTAAQYGIPAKKIIIDTLVLTASAQQDQCYKSLEAIRIIKEEYSVKTILGVSNVSFGLPNRPLLNQTYLAMGLTCGLDLGIIDPLSREIQGTLAAFRVLKGWDKDSSHFIQNHENYQLSFSPNMNDSKINSSKTKLDIKSGGSQSLRDIILKGFKDQSREKAKELLQNQAPMEIINTIIIPALDDVGKLYESGEIFLPQLIRSAETVKEAFSELKQHISLSSSSSLQENKILLATVKGDVHDIGKNIVKVLLENYGYTIIDLGKNVSSEKIMEKIATENIQLVGLSALMTTTVENMKKIIENIHEKHPNVKIMVGGAVLNSKYASMIKADFYGKDAQAAVQFAKEFFTK